MIELADIESRLTLFTEGIAGRYFHVKATDEFQSRHLDLPPDRAVLTRDTLFLPVELDASDAGGYRVLALRQLGQREFGTFRFAMAEAYRRIPNLDAASAPRVTTRQSDFSIFYAHVGHPRLLRVLFTACETTRVTARMLARYPGATRHLRALERSFARNFAPFPIDSVGDLAAAVAAAVDGIDRTLLSALDASGLLEIAFAALDNAAHVHTDVYDAARIALGVYRSWESALGGTLEPLDPADRPAEETLEWMQREARLEDWEESLALAEQTLRVEMLEGTKADARIGENIAGESRPEGVDIRALAAERDDRARRNDMERSAIRDALGAARPLARSYRYDEWDHIARRYLRHWCRLFEERLPADADVDPAELKRVIQRHAPAVQRQLEQIRPLGFQRQHRTADGDELDFDALIQARQDVRSGVSPDERVYSRRERVQRDVCAAFLVDLSASTDDPITPPEKPAPAPDAAVAAVNLRDPYDDVLALDHTTGSPGDGPPRRIIDVQRESMLVMSAALEKLGDSYGIYGFSGYGRDCVEFFVAKEPGEAFTARTLDAIAGMKPKRSTRMGPAIRHATEKLVASGNALKLLIILSDGFPQDSDYGPVRGDHEYGVQDTAQALREAHAKGVESFCVTVDKSGHDYLRRMCPEARYLILEEIEALPEVLSGVYRTLAGR